MEGFGEAPSFKKGSSRYFTFLNAHRYESMPVRQRKDLLAAMVFSASLFASGLLLFWVQPLVGKKLLPLFGGAPAVWNTCLVFFQSCLLLGYLYAHAQAKFVPPRFQVGVHLFWVIIGWICLRASVPATSTSADAFHPVVSLLLLLTLTIGLPFAVLSASAPLLQVWYARTSAARDPYFLYAASNLGSLAGLLGYPLVMEPNLSLTWQARAWSLGYLCTAALIAGAGIVMLRGKSQPPGNPSEPPGRTSPSMWWKWLAYAALPSSLLLSVTTHLTTDIAAVPLLWVVPLAVYLWSFVLVFGRSRLIPHGLVIASTPAVLVAVVVTVYWMGVKNILWLLPLNLLVLFVVSMACHGELFRMRPVDGRLTEFYLCVSAGGVLGGLFNVLVAPMLFTGIVEYPLGLVIAGLLIPTHKNSHVREAATTNNEDSISRSIPQDSDIDPTVGNSMFQKFLVMGVRGMGLFSKRLFPRESHLHKNSARGRFQSMLDIMLPVVLLFAVTLALHAARTNIHVSMGTTFVVIGLVAGSTVFLCRGRSVRFALGLAVLITGGAVSGLITGHQARETIHAQRTFFGVLQVHLNKSLDRYELIHGNTVHGSQSRTMVWSQEPSAYFFREGPLGDVFECLPRAPEGRRVAVAGLGAGTLAAYARPEDHWIFYEIDPAVRKLAEDTRYFTYLSECRARVEVIIGDARLTLAKAPAHYFDLIVLDAFSSDSIPVHLLTREAIGTYLAKLAPAGILVFQITNRYLGLNRVLASLAADRNLVMLSGETPFISTEQREFGAAPSTWVVMATNPARLSCLKRKPHWYSLRGDGIGRPWTDDYSGILTCLKIWPGFSR